MPLNPRQKAFLAAYAQTGWITAAADAADINRDTHYHWLASDEDYTAAFARAERDLCDNLVGAAIQKALIGTAKPLVSRGGLVYEPARDKATGEIIRDPETGRVMMSDTVVTVRELDSSLHQLLLKAKLPKLFRDHVEHDVSDKVSTLIAGLIEGREARRKRDAEQSHQ